MRFYELLYIVDSNFERKKIDKAMNEIDSRIKKTKSKIINHVIWGKKKLAYPMDGNKYGTYLLVHYQGGDNGKLDEFDTWLKLSDLVMRHMIVRLPRKPDVIEKIDDKNEGNNKETSNEKIDDKNEGNNKETSNEKIDDKNEDDNKETSNEKIDDKNEDDNKEISNEKIDDKNEEVE